MILKKILFITGHRKSGTTMFANLFDGHKDFCVYPSDLCLLYAFYPYFIGKNFTYQSKIKRLIHVLRTDLTQIILDNKLQNKFNLKMMLKEIKLKCNSKNIDKINKVINIVIEAFYNSLNNKKKFKYFVIKETSVDIFANQIQKWFKNRVKFIQIVRDPRDNYASLKSGAKKYYSKFGESEKRLMASLINRATLDLKFASINKKLLKKNYHVIKYEDLTKNASRVIKNICKYLNVEFDKKLLKPTILGNITKGNNYSGESFYEVSSKNVNRWAERISEDEAKIIEFYFNKEMKKFGYKLKCKQNKYVHVVEFYKWMNREYFFHDGFASKR